MASITMCVNDGCPVKDDCYRSTATPAPNWQSYFTPEYGEDGCDEFIQNRRSLGKEQTK